MNLLRNQSLFKVVSFRNMKLTILIVFVINDFLQISSGVKVSVYYETLCPDSIAFINNQLHPNYKTFGDKFIQLELIPYGFAKEEVINGTKTFTCQHGPNECYGNKVHGCIVNSEKIINSEDFIYCAESAYNPTSEQTFQQCAKEQSIKWSIIEECLSNGQADTIMSKNGEKTNALHPKWIPTIVFNDTFDADDSNQSQSNFKRVICKYLDSKPEQCRNTESINAVLM